jgi:hypothetical protein
MPRERRLTTPWVFSSKARGSLRPHGRTPNSLRSRSQLSSLHQPFTQQNRGLSGALLSPPRPLDYSAHVRSQLAPERPSGEARVARDPYSPKMRTSRFWRLSTSVRVVSRLNRARVQPPANPGLSPVGESLRSPHKLAGWAVPACRQGALGPSTTPTPK